MVLSNMHLNDGYLKHKEWLTAHNFYIQSSQLRLRCGPILIQVVACHNSKIPASYAVPFQNKLCRLSHARYGALPTEKLCSPTNTHTIMEFDLLLYS